MIKLLFGRKYSVMFSILIVAGLCALYVYSIKNNLNKETTWIFEIKNTQIVSYSRDSKIATLEKNYMIIKPPDDLHELKLLVEEFYKENPVNIEVFESEVIKTNNVTADEIMRKDVSIRFYRESRKLPRNWQPNEAYMKTDRIEHHGQDCIASILYSDTSEHKNYSVMKKSKKTNDLIPLERIEYINDKVISSDYR